MPQVVLAIAAALALLFNIFGVPLPHGTSAAPQGQPSTTDVMMLVDEVLRRA